MKISWSWLSRYVDLDGIDPVATGERFTLCVAELEGVEHVGSELKPLRAATIVATDPHPNSSRLKLVTVDLGEETRQVVCGAPNAREGLVTAFAPVGTTVQDKNGAPHTIGEATIRGVKSAGMLVSPMEMGLSEEHGGIIELPPSLASGTLLSEIAPLEDWIWDIDNKSLTHRPDLWGHYGIAREVASLVGRPLHLENPRPAFTEEDPLTIHNREHELCPRYTALYMKGVIVAPSPFWMQVLLYHAEQRPINNIVDFTNFTMLTLGNPLHAFDARQLGEKTITIRRAGEGESITTLDGQEHRLTTDDLVIADKDAPVALAGVMGGLHAEVSPDTTAVVLESATFHAGTIRRTAARLGMRTESSSRFEKSLDPHTAQAAAWFFANLVLEHCGEARIASRFYDEGRALPEATTIATSVPFIQKRLGVEIPAERIVEILRALHFHVTLQQERLLVGVPSFRATKDIGIPEDIVEEVGRIYGYGAIPPRVPSVTLEKPWSLPCKLVERRLRETLSLELGFNETMTYSFDKVSLLQRVGLDLQGAVRMKNPISKEEPVLRRTLLLNLLDAIKRNERVEEELRLYEIGRTFHPREGLPYQPRRLTAVLARRPQKEAPEGQLVYEMKYVVERIAQRLERGTLTLEGPDKVLLGRSWVHPTRSARILLSGRVVGFFSALHPAVQQAVGIKARVAFLDLEIDALSALPSVYKKFEPLPRFPGITHDVSVILDKGVLAGEAMALLKEVDPLVHQVSCVDLYEGEKFPGKRSLTFRILFQTPERTLTQDEVNHIHERIVAAVERDLGGTILR